MSAPTLHTPRLTLVGHVPDDLNDCAAMWADAAVTAMIGMPSTREEVWQRLVRYVGHWVIRPYGYWVVRETRSSRFVGEVGLMDSRRDTQPSYEGTPEAGWTLASWAHGQGYAQEAVGAMLHWADERGLSRTVCIIAPQNTRSIRLAERLDYGLVQEARYRDTSTLLFARDPLATPAAIA